MSDSDKKIFPAGSAQYALLPLRNIVVFPDMIVPLFVGREKSVHALEAVIEKGGKILLVAQKDGEKDDPKPKDMYSIGTVGTVLQMLKLPDGTLKVLVEGEKRATIETFIEGSDYFQVKAKTINDKADTGKETEGIMRSVVSQFENYLKLNRKIPREVLSSASQLESPAKLADMIASHLNVKIPEKQKILEALSIQDRLEMIMSHMEREAASLRVEKKIRGRVKRQMEKTQREYYLNEQLKAIHKELGEGEDGKDEIAELEDKLKKIKFTKEAKEKVKAEIKKLRNMSPMSAEATVVRNYLDWMLAIPWGKKGKVKKDIDQAAKQLDKDHYGLEKVKERILEHLAVQQRSKKLRGPILCFVGPPGVGKTSLGKSIAQTTGREFIRIALGGVRDESEIRGHRRTYIGSMPGKIVQSMKKVKTNNPLIMLDEIDKLGADWRGDPSSALLEVLDPEQNNSFNDHYLEVDYDLSNVMFVTTANTLNIPRPLMDRMEVIHISGYTEEEKLEIAKGYLVGQAMEEHALKKKEFAISDAGILELIRRYTREAGVRNLQREIARLARKAVRKLVSGKAKNVKINAKNVNEYSGIPKFNSSEMEKKNQVGVVTGLAWTEVGGVLLTIEGVMVPGKGRMTTTGTLGDVMKESIGAASSYVRSRSIRFGIEPPMFERRDIHVHLPEGATPKDGPSAGVAMATSIVSLMTGIKVRREVAMTGEITLRGRVLAIGGLKEKLLAALRSGIKKVLIPKANEKDLPDLPNSVRKGLEIICVETMDEVLEHALTRVPKAIKWDEKAYLQQENLPVGDSPSRPHH